MTQRGSNRGNGSGAAQGEAPPLWRPGRYERGAVRVYLDGPYRCLRAHDSSLRPDWDPERSPALWQPCHGRSPAAARPYVRPETPRHAYRPGEWTLSAGRLWACLRATLRRPEEDPRSWREEPIDTL